MQILIHIFNECLIIFGKIMHFGYIYSNICYLLFISKFNYWPHHGISQMNDIIQNDISYFNKYTKWENKTKKLYSDKKVAFDI